MSGDYMKVGQLRVNLKLLVFKSYSVLPEVISSLFISLTLSKVSSFSFICRTAFVGTLHFPRMTDWGKDKRVAGLAMAARWQLGCKHPQAPRGSKKSRSLQVITPLNTTANHD